MVPAEAQSNRSPTNPFAAARGARCGSGANVVRPGFTLLELLISLALMAILTVSLYAAMTGAFRAREGARRQVDGVAGAMIALDVIGQDLQSVLPPSPTATDDATASHLTGPFVGTSEGGPTGPAGRMNFFALGRDGLGPAADQQAAFDPLADGPRQVEIALDTASIPPRLVRRIRRNILGDGALDVQEEPLTGGVRGLGLRYYDGTSWLESWDSAALGDVLPLAVEITLELDQPSPIDPSRFYRVTQIVPVACARPPADATATQ